MPSIEGKGFTEPTDRLYLGLCLEVCLADAELRSSASGQCLREALEQLDIPLEDVQRTTGTAVVPFDTLVSFLRYLLPELERVAPDAASVVWQAVGFLEPDASPTGKPH